MIILQLVTKRQYRGAEVFAANLSEELIGFGHEIIFAGLYKNTSNVLEVKAAENLDISGEKGNNFSLSLVRNLISLVKRTNPDVIQCNGSDTLKYMVAASYFLPKVPIIYRNISTISEWMGSRTKLELYKAIFNRVDHVTSVGSAPIEDLISTLNFPKDKTSVIRRGIPCEQKEIASCTQELRKELNLHPDTKIVMHVGNFSPEKNHIFLLDVFEKIAKNNSEIKLVCVGDGITYSKIQSEIQKRNLGDTIILLGFKKNIAELLAGADCVVLSSLIEGVPGVILEAAVQGKPSVASNVGGVKEVLINEKTGYIIDDFDIDEFAEKITQLCLNNDLRFKLGQNGRELALNEFDPIKNARKFEKLYASLSGIDLQPVQKKNKKLRILQIIQKKQLRGAEVFCCQLSNHLLKLGHEVEVYSIFDGTSELKFQKGVKCFHGNQNMRHFDYRGWKNIHEVIKAFKPDLVQANAADTLKYTVYSKKMFGWKQPILYRNATSVSSYYINTYLTNNINSFLLKNVNHIFSVSDFSKNDLVQLYSNTKDKTEVIPIGIDELHFENKSVLKENSFNLIHIGSLTEEKNHLGLLQIFQSILNEKNNIHLNIIGDGPLRNKIEEKIILLGLEMSVSFHGEVSNPYDYIKQADVMVLPSIIEGMPAVLLEAMYCKTPVVAYNVGGIPEIVNEHTGFLIEKGEQEAFKNAVLEILAVKPEHKIQNAYNMVKKDFMNDKIAERFVDSYQQLVVEKK